MDKFEKDLLAALKIIGFGFTLFIGVVLFKSLF